ncbi:hypothetical protein ACQ86O_21255 [Serratia sp. L9]|uniref:hypothetical protein n=1 Tax=Serratia sp. L9 TaxID=3423946 RepID=UPI003D670C04
MTGVDSSHHFNGSTEQGVRCRGAIEFQSVYGPNWRALAHDWLLFSSDFFGFEASVTKVKIIGSVKVADMLSQT